MLVYTDASSDVPTEWEDSDPRYIQNAADVKLRSFTTKVIYSCDIHGYVTGYCVAETPVWCCIAVAAEARW